MAPAPLSLIRRVGLAALLAASLPGGVRAQPDPTFPPELLAEVADDAPLPALWLNRAEVLAFDKLVLHTREIPLGVQHRAARRDLTFAILFGPDRVKYRGQLVHIEGRLRLLRKLELPSTLQGMMEGLNELYEGWILDLPSGGFYCVVCSELPPGLKPAEEIDRPVTADAYFFKRYEYETRERAAQGGQVRRLAPLLIGRTITPRAAEAAGTGVWAIPGAVLAGTLALVGLSVAVGLGVAWWLRREDRKVRARLQLNQTILRHDSLTEDH